VAEGNLEVALDATLARAEKAEADLATARSLVADYEAWMSECPVCVREWGGQVDASREKATIELQLTKAKFEDGTLMVEVTYGHEAHESVMMAVGTGETLTITVP
jgi:hypothetical protein